jgi:hypothetical protein
VIGGTPCIIANATPAELTERREAIRRNHAQIGVAIVDGEAVMVAAALAGEEVVKVGGFGCISMFQSNWDAVSEL